MAGARLYNRLAAEVKPKENGQADFQLPDRKV
jgi:hypothetical protein